MPVSAPFLAAGLKSGRAVTRARAASESCRQNQYGGGRGTLGVDTRRRSYGGLQLLQRGEQIGHFHLFAHGVGGRELYLMKMGSWTRGLAATGSLYHYRVTQHCPHYELVGASGTT